MVDKVKPLVMEDSLSGTQLLPMPGELNPLQDYISVKGIAFENLNSYLYEKIGNTLIEKFPDLYQSTTYLGNGEVSYIEYFKSPTFISANRVARVDLTYDLDLNPELETTLIYAEDGTSIVRTIVYTHQFSGVEYVSTSITMN